MVVEFWCQMALFRVVLDTNVVFAAAKSGSGASAALLRLALDGEIELWVSELVWGEYCGVLRRSTTILGRSAEEIEAFLEFVASVLHLTDVYFHWRPTLRDAGDDKVLECAVAASADFLVTFNTRDFAQGQTFAPRIVTPSEFLQVLVASRENGIEEGTTVREEES